MQNNEQMVEPLPRHQVYKIYQEALERNSATISMTSILTAATLPTYLIA
jgi:hypothetical protein